MRLGRISRVVGVGLVLGVLLVGAVAVVVRRVRHPQMQALSTEQTFELEELVSGLKSPVFATHPGDGSGRLFLVEQPGQIRIWREGALEPEPFLDVQSLVVSGGEQGLLGLAFHPDYGQNGRFFLNYTRAADGSTVVSEWRVSSEPSRAQPDSERVLLVVAQPWGNHNGGHLAFGGDGRLYVGFGDGGSANDPRVNGQNTETLLGSIVRLDVDAGEPYGIPADNPFAKGGGRPEIFAWGLRNPWRFSFDRLEPSRLFAGDVGQGSYEEVHLVQLGDNCGWRVMEGRHVLTPSDPHDPQAFASPIAEYDRSEGQSVTGGYVYRGSALPEWSGLYVFSDYYPSDVWGLSERPDGSWERVTLGSHDFYLSSFGEDEAGELLLVDHAGGRVLRVVPKAS